MSAPEASSPLERAVRGSTIALAAMPVLGLRPMVWGIALWLLLFAARAIVRRPTADRSAWRWWLTLSAPFLLMLLDLFRADDPRNAWHIVERSAALVVFPTGFLLLSAPADRRVREQAIDVLTLAALALSLFVNIGLLVGPALSPDARAFSDRYREAFGVRSGIHPPYAAYYFVCGALLQFAALLRGTNARPLRIAVALLLLVSAALIGSRMPLIAFLVALFPTAMAGATNARPLRWAAGGAVVLIAVMLLTPVARERLQLTLDGPLVTPTTATVDAENVRVAVAHCSLELLEAHWIAGMGQEHVQPALDRCYRQFGIPLLLDGSYSTHCQPLHWWIALGLPGLAAFVLLFGLPLRAAWKAGDGAAAGFVVLIGLCCLTENVLARQWGVVLFAYVNTLLIAGRGRA